MKKELAKLMVPFGVVAFSSTAVGADKITTEELSFLVNNLWLLIASAMVFIMHLGFACIEAGSIRSKNMTTILYKNTAIIAIGILTYTLVGFNLMYPGESFAGGLFGFTGFGLKATPEGMTSAYNANYTYLTDFIFQAMFAATAATIVSGAIAERVKHGPFLLFATLFLSLIYPIVGMWKWGGGFLNTMATPFYDFAGSSLVHSVGGWAALAGVLVLGPRLERFKEGNEDEFKAGNQSLMCIGAFLLWFGWYGFNGGSVLSANPAALSLVFVTTSIGAAAGVVGAMVLARVLKGYNDLGSALNGALGGLVAITAGADVMGPLSAAIAGTIGGLLVVIASLILERIKLDDPVGAIPVHLVAGIWGTLAVGLLGGKASASQFASQLIGIGIIGLFTFSTSYFLFVTIQKFYVMRVTADEEAIGLDKIEHSRFGALNGFISAEGAGK